MMDASRWAASRGAAKALFGRPVRIILAAWILDRDEPFFLQEAQEGLRPYGEAPTAVRDELQVFVDFEMVSRFPDGRRIYFAKLESPLWPAMEAAAAALAELAPSTR